MPSPSKISRQKKRKYIVLPPPSWSSRLYVRLVQKDARLFRYLLEAEDNLAYTSVTDRKACIFKITFSPHQEKELRTYLKGMQQTMPFEIIEAPLLQWEKLNEYNRLPSENI